MAVAAAPSLPCGIQLHRPCNVPLHSSFVCWSPVTAKLQRACSARAGVRCQMALHCEPQQHGHELINSTLHAASTSTAVAGQQSKAVGVDITKTSVTSRKIDATVCIEAPVEVSRTWQVAACCDQAINSQQGIMAEQMQDKAQASCIQWFCNCSRLEWFDGFVGSAACKCTPAHWHTVL